MIAHDRQFKPQDRETLAINAIENIESYLESLDILGKCGIYWGEEFLVLTWKSDTDGYSMAIKVDSDFSEDGKLDPKQFVDAVIAFSGVEET